MLSRSRLLPIAAAALVVLLAAAGWLWPRTSDASTSADAAAVRNAIAAVLDAPTAPNAVWGVYVQNLRTGEVVASRNADRSLLPASTLKLVTTAAALDVLGPNYRFATRLYFDGAAEEATLRGDLVIRGGGDPTFGSVLSGSDPLAEWARQLHQMGVRRVEGRIIGDASAMDTQPYAAGWDIDYIATAHWAAPASGLTYSDNLATVEVAGTRAGQPATVNVTPGGYIALQGELGTRGGRGGFSPLRIERVLGTNIVTLDGSVSAGYRGSIRLPVHDPARFTVAAFADRLRRAGIEVAADLLDASDLDRAPAYNTDPLFIHHSPPLVNLLTVINHRSNNLYAEQVFRVLSGSASARGSAQRIVGYLQRSGVSASGLSMRDGSGLSRKNLITPQTMGQLLAHLYTSDKRDAYLATIPRGGQANTTMRFRLGGEQVWAKTGSLEHVRALAGYALGPDGSPYTFVLFANHFTDNPAAISVAQNQMVQAITSGGAAPAAAPARRR
jgi:serine-type D-Ala-D-Ala carboxypeptidase/endopeptidase (penicillin-binding protein 4)